MPSSATAVQWWLAVAAAAAVSSSLALASADTCPYCHIREEQRRAQIDAIKAQILQKLGMEKEPNMTGRQLPKMTESLREIYMKDARAQNQQRPRDQQYSTDDDEEDHSQLEKLWTFASRSPLAEGDGALARDMLRNQIVYFELSPSITELDLEEAILWLFVKGHRHRKRDRSLQVRIMKVVMESSGNYILKDAMSTTIRVHKPGYAQLSIRNLAQDWFRYPRENFGIIISTRDSKDRRNLSINSFEDVPPGNTEGLPVLEVHVSNSRRRTKRTTSGNFCTDNTTETNCCRFPLVVDFHEFGWDWIIAPPTYDANYCSGNCPYVYLQKYPHTHIVQQVGGTSGPCCGPRKLSPIHMLYWDTFEHIRFDMLPNMIVESCGCH